MLCRGVAWWFGLVADTSVLKNGQLRQRCTCRRRRETLGGEKASASDTNRPVGDLVRGL